MFGIGARTEILRYFLFRPHSKMTTNALAEATAYTKRNVAEVCDLLVQADLLSAKAVGNRYYYSLTDLPALANFVGPIPEVVIDWNALLRVVGTIKTLSDATDELSLGVLTVETHAAARGIEEDLDVLGIDGPRQIRGSGILDEWDLWSAKVMAGVAAGIWPAELSRANYRLRVNP